MKCYLMIVDGSVEPRLVGPYATEAERDEQARHARHALGDEDGLFWLNVGENGVPFVGSYSSAFFSWPVKYKARARKHTVSQKSIDSDDPAG